MNDEHGNVISLGMYRQFLYCVYAFIAGIIHTILKMNFSLKLVFLLCLLSAISSGRQVTGLGNAAFFDSTTYSDAIRLTMTNVSAPSGGMEYVAWLVHDDDVQHTKLGTLSVAGGNVSLTYKDDADNNLLGSHKKIIITQETAPFSGSSPTLSAITFSDSLHGPGNPASASSLTRIRNCLVTFPNTKNSLGLAVWMKRNLKDCLDHAGFARSGAINNNIGEARTHCDHVIDFSTGALSGLVAGNTSVAQSVGDPVGRGFRRYGDLGTKDSLQGGAGSMGGAGYHVSFVVNDPSSSEQMKKAGGRALVALQNTFGANNDAGLAKQVTDRALNIINGVYQSGNLVTEGDPFLALADDFLNGTIGASDTGAVTGGLRQSYFHIQQMALFALYPVVISAAEQAKSQRPESFSLGANFPNPFNAGTTIPFDLPARSRVRVVIFDNRGRKVARLLENVEFEAGSHFIRWSGEEMASGIYFCQFEAVPFGRQETFTDTRRFVYIK